jgi:hypothetical protein
MAIAFWGEHINQLTKFLTPANNGSAVPANVPSANLAIHLAS